MKRQTPEEKVKESIRVRKGQNGVNWASDWYSLQSQSKGGKRV
jgi:hypothetical protein